MNESELLNLYDRTMRYEANDPLAVREEVPPVVRLVNQEQRRATLVYSQLNNTAADPIIMRERLHYQALGYHFEWNHYAHDQPIDLAERLRAHGFVAEEPEALMVLDLAQAPAALLDLPADNVRRLTDTEELATTLTQFAYLWGNNEHWLAGMLIDTIRRQPGHLSIYVAYVADEPASVAWIRYSSGKPFAGLYGGSTREHYRRRGLYSALVAARAREAQTRGVRYLTIGALPTSRPIVEKLSFKQLGVRTPFLATENTEVTEVRPIL
jgi:GNAT superfamily N-acetyltransferase